MWGNTFMEKAGGYTAEEASFATIVLALGWLLGSPVMGILSDRWGSRRLPLMIGSVGGGAAMCVLLWPAMLGYEGLLVFMFIAGIFTSTQVICFAASMEVAPKPLRGTATACCNFITMMVAAVLQIWIGWVLTPKSNLQVIMQRIRRLWIRPCYLMLLQPQSSAGQWGLFPHCSSWPSSCALFFPRPPRPAGK